MISSGIIGMRFCKVLLSVIVISTAMSSLALSTMPWKIGSGIGRRMITSLAPRTRASTSKISSYSRLLSTIDYFSSDILKPGIAMGDYSLIASQGAEKKQYSSIGSLGSPNGPQVGEKVWLRGRVTSLRAKGNACFAVIRNGPYYSVQICHFKSKANPQESKELLQFMSGLSLESIVDIYGTIASADVKSCSQNKVEIQVRG